MDIIWQGHHAVISERLREKAATALTKLERRLDRAVRATVRFEREGTRCRVELILTTPRHRPMVAEGNGRYYGPALAIALGHLQQQVTAEKRTVKDRAARTVRR
jgi:ribosome-associated translation inhibitor RaiA